MDAIQRTLIKAGRRDLAQKYYHKVKADTPHPEDDSKFQIIEKAVVDLNHKVKGLDKKFVEKVSRLWDEAKSDYSTLMKLYDLADKTNLKIEKAQGILYVPINFQTIRKINKSMSGLHKAMIIIKNMSGNIKGF